MKQLDIVFDAPESARKKKEGMEIAASKRNPDLELAREIARELCLKNGSCDADQVGKELLERYGINSLGPAAGSIFKSGEFEATGKFVRSARKSNNARLIWVWKLRD